MRQPSQNGYILFGDLAAEFPSISIFFYCFLMITIGSNDSSVSPSDVEGI